jgi:hypothetical protein
MMLPQGFYEPKSAATATAREEIAATQCRCI